MSHRVTKSLQNLGFTLIELLVVISIIALLSSVVLASLASARAKARDARRSADMQEIVKALESYNNINGCLPSTSTSACPGASTYSELNAGGWDYSSQGQFLTFLATGTDPIFSKVPVDPINNMTGDGTPVGSFAYRYYCYNQVGNYGVSLSYFKEYPVWTQVNVLVTSVVSGSQNFLCR
jgi:prepilin-type N-terminal cleavage/methylation domain-containing protein